MSVVQGYTRSVLAPQLQALGLSKTQRAIIVADVTMRLESLLSHWHDLEFRRTILLLGTEEGTFWEPRTASLEIRSLVVVAVRNSLIEDLHASQPFTEAVRSGLRPLPDALMPSITGEAVTYFEASNLDAEHAQPTRDIFGSLRHRFPNAWRALSLLGNSSNVEVDFQLPAAKPEPFEFRSFEAMKDDTVFLSGIDPTLDGRLAKKLRQIAEGESSILISSCFKRITRNPEKLFFVIEHILRHGGTLLTPNYLLSPVYVARRDPLLRPAQTPSQDRMHITNPAGLSKRHWKALNPSTTKRFFAACLRR